MPYANDRERRSLDDDGTHNCHLRRLHWMQMFMNMAREEVEGQSQLSGRQWTTGRIPCAWKIKHTLNEIEFNINMDTRVTSIRLECILWICCWSTNWLCGVFCFDWIAKTIFIGQIYYLTALMLLPTQLQGINVDRMHLCYELFIRVRLKRLCLARACALRSAFPSSRVQGMVKGCAGSS